MKEFATRIQESNEFGEQIQEASNHVLDMTDEGSQLMNGTTNQMTNIYQTVKESVHKVSELNFQSQEISKLVTVIKEIADQTNLLALNAAIEAARAGNMEGDFRLLRKKFENWLSKQLLL